MFGAGFMTGAQGRLLRRDDLSSVLGQDGCFTPTFLRWLEDQDDCVLLETVRKDRDERLSHVFLEPVACIECRSLDQVEDGLQEVQRAIDEGLHAAGFLSYELAYALERGCSLQATPSAPLLWMGVYERPWTYDHQAQSFEQGRERALRLAEALSLSPYTPVIHELLPLPSISEQDFYAALRHIKEQIRQGNTYQVNFSFKMRFPWEHRLTDLYYQLRASQRVAYSAFLKAGKTPVLSFSPELFFRTEQGRILLRPMKGTAPRGQSAGEDDRNRSELKNSSKDRAENLMIVDLLRSDVGRIAETGTVSVPEFFALEEYETVFQATSLVEARLKPTCSFPELIRSLFPSGSVTGAPKIRTMQIIQELEKEERGVYTGAIGFIGPRRRAVFNVAIRTIQIDTSRAQAEMGVGSGITYESELAGEYRECLDKTRFLGASPERFELLETIRWDPDSGWLLLEEHLRRLDRSAIHFEFTVDRERVLDSLRALEPSLKDLTRGGPGARVRLVVKRQGEIEITSALLSPVHDLERVALAFERIDPRNRFLYHKTTNRQFYDRALRDADARGLFDWIFLNDREEVTEGARSNVIIRCGRQHFTPPVSCGLLPGVYRAHLLAGGRIELQEKVLSREELDAADQVFCCNSVRGLQRVEIVESPSPG